MNALSPAPVRMMARKALSSDNFLNVCVRLMMVALARQLRRR